MQITRGELPILLTATGDTEQSRYPVVHLALAVEYINNKAYFVVYPVVAVTKESQTESELVDEYESALLDELICRFGHQLAFLYRSGDYLYRIDNSTGKFHVFNSQVIDM
jgi:hypothetical protein